jgi:hypothetical protein
VQHKFLSTVLLVKTVEAVAALGVESYFISPLFSVAIKCDGCGTEVAEASLRLSLATYLERLAEQV